jgi:hypothetical protein
MPSIGMEPAPLEQRQARVYLEWLILTLTIVSLLPLPRIFLIPSLHSSLSFPSSVHTFLPPSPFAIPHLSLRLLGLVPLRRPLQCAMPLARQARSPAHLPARNLTYILSSHILENYYVMDEWMKMREPA